MSLVLIFVLFIAVAVYWFVTQIRPEQRRIALMRHGVGVGIFNHLNEKRAEEGLASLELDDELCAVAENKATHQILTGRSDEGWDYPPSYAGLLGQSLLMEALFSGTLDTMRERVRRQAELLDEEWVRCGIGAAGGNSSQVVVAMILCREAWEPAHLGPEARFGPEGRGRVAETGSGRSLVDIVMGRSY